MYQIWYGIGSLFQDMSVEYEKNMRVWNLSCGCLFLDLPCRGFNFTTVPIATALCRRR